MSTFRGFADWLSAQAAGAIGILKNSTDVGFCSAIERGPQLLEKQNLALTGILDNTRKARHSAGSTLIKFAKNELSSRPKVPLQHDRAGTLPDVLALRS